MARRVKHPSPLSDPRYVDFVARYRHDWRAAAQEVFGVVPTDQQDLIIDAFNPEASMVSVSSGHGSGKSALLGLLSLLYIICYPGARVLLLSNKVGQTLSGLLKYAKIHWHQAIKRFPWLTRYFELTSTTFRAKCQPGIWCLFPKSFQKNSEESLAGEHADHLAWIVDEASAISTRAFGIITGSLTSKDNRMIMLSQPTRNSGYFFDSQHSLAKTRENPDGIFTALKINSEMSPLVSRKWLKMKAIELGGIHSDDYQIKVRGEFAAGADGGMLLSRLECQAAQLRKVRIPLGWGWVATADVGDGGDKSVLIISRVWGDGHERIVVPRYVFSTKRKALNFAGWVNAKLRSLNLPNISVAADAGGVGGPFCDELERLGWVVKRIVLGDTPFSHLDQQRYINERARVNFLARDAITSGRLKMPPGEVFVSEASRIPIFVNEASKYQLASKKNMREAGITSPDHWDALTYTYVAHYSPADAANSEEFDEERRRIREEFERVLNGEDDQREAG